MDEDGESTEEDQLSGVRDGRDHEQCLNCLCTNSVEMKSNTGETKRKSVHLFSFCRSRLWG